MEGPQCRFRREARARERHRPLKWWTVRKRLTQNGRLEKRTCSRGSAFTITFGTLFEHGQMGSTMLSKLAIPAALATALMLPVSADAQFYGPGRWCAVVLALGM